ncbi:MAG TPA: tRNA (adenosine(37)-N6)-dimethylallyltransferase MiaA [Candidatus Brocadiia bacterium]|nr:tRNA (adenosine(37)-N6)-dimethylallyltransferase MiaA [Candidatus Brocadiia bacterium]
MPKWVLLGPTASGKSDVALSIARRAGAEILSVDSMQIYRGMDIGTAKPTPEERSAIPHRLIDVADPGEYWSVGRFIAEANRVIDDCEKRGARILIVGGTALYLKALLHGIFDAPGADPDYRALLDEIIRTKGLAELHRMLKEVDPESAAKLHPNDKKRVVRALEVYHLTGRGAVAQQTQFSVPPDPSLWRIFGLRWDREELYRRIDRRVDLMIERGFEAEVRRLLDSGNGLGPQSSQALGYKEFASYIRDEIPRDEAIRLIKRNTRRFARRQLQWFAKFAGVEWIDVSEATGGPRAAAEAVMELLAQEHGGGTLARS